MIRALLVILLLLSAPSPVRAAPDRALLTGRVVGYRLSGIEPDGDPIDQVILSTTLASAHGIPRLHLIVSSYLENFKPDTTPVLPDLLHPQHDAQNMGGFLEGKSLITDDAGDILYVGDFLAEAFFNNTNHAVFSLSGRGPARGGHVTLKGIFTLHRDASLSGTLSGTITLPAAARAQLRAHAGRTMRSIKDIISAVTVHPAPMMGRSTTGNSRAVLHTGYGPTPSSHRALNPITIIAGIGVVVSLLWAGLLLRNDRRRRHT